MHHQLREVAMDAMHSMLPHLAHPPFGLVTKEIIPHNDRWTRRAPTCGRRMSLLPLTSPIKGQGVGFMVSMNYGSITVMINEGLVEFV
jgi:hypothetical protein